jgi:predicted amidophosphoribosyltransferase
MMICTLCETQASKLVLPPYLCPHCEDGIGATAMNHCESFGVGDVHVVFQYSGEVRELIVRAKVKNDTVALGFLLRELSRHVCETVQKFDHGDTLIIPAPSSFWGRAHGRFDVAQMACLSLFSQAQVYLGLMPGSFLRMKRAGRNTNDDQIPYMRKLRSIVDFMGFIKSYDLDLKISRAKRILVVDDVMTTGFTMRTIFNQLIELGAQSVDGLVIASSSYSSCNDSNNNL